MSLAPHNQTVSELVLCFHFHYVSFPPLPSVMQPHGSLTKAYSPNVLVQIPMKHLLQYARQRQGDFATLYPSLLKLTATHFPQLCLVEDWLKEEECAKCECVCVWGGVRGCALCESADVKAWM